MSSSSRLKTAIVYPDSDSASIAESDSARDYLAYSVEALQLYFQNRPDVYVSGNLFIYYQQGVPSAVIAPDVFVIFGVEKKQRMSYKTWEENQKLPEFVLEITSKTTQTQDQEDKPIKYARLGVREYFQYDPTGDYLHPQLKGYTLVDNQYIEKIVTAINESDYQIASEVLRLELHVIDGKLRFLDPSNRKYLGSYQEIELARQQAELEKQQAELARQEAELEKQQAELARQEAESEKQQAELARQEAESEKQQAELARQQAELRSTQIELEKQQAELARQQAESEKQQAELARQQAEQKIRDAIPRLQALGLTREEIGITLNISAEEINQYLYPEN